MGTTQTDVPSAEAPRNTRRNEIVAISSSQGVAAGSVPGVI